MDETCIQHFTLLSNQQSAEWTAAGESHWKQPKTQTPASKVLASVFWDAQCILFIDYLEKGRTISRKCYVALLVRLKGGRTHDKTATNEGEKAHFHQDNSPCHKPIATMAKLYELHFELLPHLRYSSNLAPSDYCLFVDLKRMLQRKRFDSNEEVISETEVFWGQRQIVQQ